MIFYSQLLVPIVNYQERYVKKIEFLHLSSSTFAKLFQAFSVLVVSLGRIQDWPKETLWKLCSKVFRLGLSRQNY